MKVEVAILGSPSLIVRTVCVDVKQHWTNSQSHMFRSFVTALTLFCRAVSALDVSSCGHVVVQWPFSTTFAGCSPRLLASGEDRTTPKRKTREENKVM